MYALLNQHTRGFFALSNRQHPGHRFTTVAQSL